MNTLIEVSTFVLEEMWSFAPGVYFWGGLFLAAQLVAISVRGDR